MLLTNIPWCYFCKQFLNELLTRIVCKSIAIISIYYELSQTYSHGEVILVSMLAYSVCCILHHMVLMSISK